MKYYSEMTDTVYDSVEALEEAEKKLKDKIAVKDCRTKEIETIFCRIRELQGEITRLRKEGAEMIDSFYKDYNTYPVTKEQYSYRDPLEFLFSLFE